MQFILRDKLYNQNMWEEVCFCCFVTLLNRENAKDSLFCNDGVFFCSENDAAERVDIRVDIRDKREGR